MSTSNPQKRGKPNKTGMNKGNKGQGMNQPKSASDIQYQQPLEMIDGDALDALLEQKYSNGGVEEDDRKSIILQNDNELNDETFGGAELEGRLWRVMRAR